MLFRSFALSPSIVHLPPPPTIQVLGINVSAYKQRVGLLPYFTTWNFTGLSMEGCALSPYGPCLSWINGQNFPFVGLQVRTCSEAYTNEVMMG